MSSDHESKSSSRLAALQWPIILTIGVILFLSIVSGVFYLYVLDRERYYNERYFRLLHTEAEGVSQRLENYKHVIYSAGRLGIDGQLRRIKIGEDVSYEYRYFPKLSDAGHDGRNVELKELYHSFRSTKCVERPPSDLLAFDIALQLCQVSDFHNVSVDSLDKQLDALNPFKRKRLRTKNSQSKADNQSTVPEGLAKDQRVAHDVNSDQKMTGRETMDKDKTEDPPNYLINECLSKRRVRGAAETVSEGRRRFWANIEKRSTDSIFVMQAVVPRLVIREDVCSFSEWWITAEADGKNLFGKILLEQSFDDLLLLDKKGNVLFQNGDSGLQFAQISRLLSRSQSGSEHGAQTLKLVSAKGESIGDIEPPITVGSKDGGNLLKKVPAREEVVVGDKNLLVYAMPVSLPISREQEQEIAESDSIGEPTYVLVGLINKDRFRNETWQLSPSLLLILLLVALLTLLALPLLKLLLMAPQDQWTVRDFALIVGSSIIGTGLLALTLVDSGAFWWTKRLVDDELKYFANSMHANVREEFNAAIRALVMLDSRKAASLLNEENALKNDPDLKSDDVWRDEECQRKKKRTRVPNVKLNILEVREEPSFYTAFDSIFWVDCGGRLMEHWDTRTKNNYFPTIVTRLSDRTYFRNIIEKRTWNWNMEGNALITIEPLFSRLNGSNTAVLAIQSKVEGAGPHDITVAGLESRFLSLFEPIIPPGAGFAVVDSENGRVLFHSEGQRNLREHFFEEIDHNRKLKGLITTRSQGCEDGIYGGNAHRFCVNEFKDIPWALVVFKNMEPLRTANLQAVTVACFLFAIYAIAVLLVVISGLILAKMWRRTVPDWLWPAKKQYDSYEAGASVALILFLLGLLTLWLFPPHYAFVLGVIIFPIFGAIAAFVLLKRPIIPEKCPSEKDIRRAYLALCGSILALCSVLPAIVCMMLSYEAEQTLILKAGALDLAKSFARSADQVREKYQYHKAPSLIAKRLCGRVVNLDVSCRVDNVGRLDVHLDKKPDKDWWWMIKHMLFLEDQFPIEVERVLGDSASAIETDDWFKTIYRSWRVPYNDEFTKTHGLFRQVQQSEDIQWTENTTVSYRSVQAVTRLDIDQQRRVERWHVTVAFPTWRIRLPAVFLLSLVLGVASFALRGTFTMPKGLSRTNTVWIAASIALVLMFCLLQWPGETLLSLWVLASVLLLFWWLIHVLPGFVARRVFLLNLSWHELNAGAFVHKLQIASSPAGTEFNKEQQQKFEKEFGASKRLCVEIGKAILKDDDKRADFLWADLSDGFEPDPVGVFALDEARHYYGSVWEEMNKEEKMALFHLARNGFIVGTHPSLLSLVKKGWVTRSPGLHFVNDGFRQFVLSKKDEIFMLQQDFEKGIWDQLVWPVGIGTMFVLAGLMYTQQELLASATAFVGILGGLVPVISKLFDLFRTQKSGSPAS